MYLDQQQASGGMMGGLLADVEVDRLRRVALHGVPPAIPQWDGWFYPSSEDLTRLWYFMEGEERRGITSLDSDNWLWVGESPLVPHI
jgi:hypothetical protein